MDYAVPDVAYTNPSDGKEKIVELKFINQCPTRYGRDVATSLRTATVLDVDSLSASA